MRLDIKHPLPTRHRLAPCLSWGPGPTQVKPLLLAVEAKSARVASQVRDVLEKSRALQARHFKQLSDRIDVIKKGGTVGVSPHKSAEG